jgi:hypothetical protein
MIPKIICVCAHCGSHDSENVAIEINFQENKIYYYCKVCVESGKSGKNAMTIEPPLKPLPKTRRMGM